VFTIWTYCVAPTSPFVSGGRQLQLLGRLHGSPKGRQIPSKFWIGPEIGPVPFLPCTTGSFVPGGDEAGLSDSISRLWIGPCRTGSTGSELTSGEVPWKSPWITCGPAVAVLAAVAAPARPVVPPELLARAIPVRRVAPFPVVPEPAIATTRAASTIGSEATTKTLRRDFSSARACGTSFRDILIHPPRVSLCIPLKQVEVFRKYRDQNL